MGLNNGNTIDQTDFVSTSSGAGDANKVEKLNSAGKHNLDFAGFNGAHVYQSAGTTIGVATYVALTFTAETYDTDTIHDNATNTTRLTVPTGKGGKYLIGASLYVAAAGGQASLRIRLNGTTIIANNTGYAESGTANGMGSVTTVYQLAAGDYIEVLGAHGDSASRSSSGDLRTNFWMHRLAA